MKKIKVMFCCARLLGIRCLANSISNKNIEIVGISTTAKDKQVWWTDVKEEFSVEAFGYKDKLVDFKDISSFIKQNKPDIVFSILTDYIFKQEDIDNCRYGIINLHPAKLPDYRGCNSYAHAITNGEKKYGVTMHYVDNTIDTGSIIEVSLLDILPEDTGRTLYDKAQVLAFHLFKKQFLKIVYAALKNKKVKAQKQNDSKSRYYDRNSLKSIKQINKADLVFENEEQTVSIYDRVRALEFEPFEPSYIVDDNNKIYLKTRYR